MADSGELAFRFQYALPGGQTIGWGKKNGTTTPQGLVLAEEPLAYDDIVDTSTRGERLLLALKPGLSLGKRMTKALVKGNVLILQVARKQALPLERHIDRICSQHEAARQQAALSAAGKGNQMRESRAAGAQAAAPRAAAPAGPALAEADAPPAPPAVRRTASDG